VWWLMPPVVDDTRGWMIIHMHDYVGGYEPTVGSARTCRHWCRRRSGRRSEEESVAYTVHETAAGRIGMLGFP